MNVLRIGLFVPFVAALLSGGCKSPEPISRAEQPASISSSAPSATVMPAPVASSSAAGGAAIIAQSPTSASSTASPPDAGTLASAVKYPETPCDHVANDFREFTSCWGQTIEAVRDELDDMVASERKRGSAVNALTAALLRDEEKWEAKRTARCNAMDNGQMGQGLGSVGQLSVARCRYDADRKRLAAFQTARDKPGVRAP